MAFNREAVLESVKKRGASSSNLDWKLIDRILKAEKSLALDRVLSHAELAGKAIDVHAKYIEFYANVSAEPIYTLDDDSDAREQVDRVSNLFDNRVQGNVLLKETLNLSDIRVPTVAKAIHENPDVIDALRYLSGLGEITFELLASGWLHKEHFFAGIVRFHGLETIKHLAGDNLQAANCIAAHFVQEHHIRPSLEMLSKLSDQQRIGLVELIASYQLIGHLSKKSGHKAEMIIAKHLDSMKVPFEPKEKLTVLGSPDIEVPSLGRGRLFDLVIPNKDTPKVIIECAYYNSNVGSVASKVIRELRGTLNEIKHGQDETVRGVKLIGFVDGAGWVAMSGHLIKILLVLDDFVQLSTLSKVTNYL